MTDNGSGRIITFYSYKGGTGRTMALANTAWILASNGGGRPTGTGSSPGCVNTRSPLQEL